MRPIAAVVSLALIAASPIPAVAQVIPDGAEPEKVADGYRFTEGPAAGPDGCIYFTDIPAELILKYDPETGETEEYFHGTNQANGLMFDPNGQLIGCTHGSRMLIHFRRISNTSWSQGPAGPNHFEGNKLNSPNDLAIDEAGNIYFTDPRYGNRDSMEMEVEGVYFRSAERNEDPDIDDGLENESGVSYFKLLERIADDLTRPNGIVLSPDESVLYIADNGTNEIFAYDVTAPGEIENKRLFARLNDGNGRGGPDGMCVDPQGRLYAAGQNRVWVYNPDGSAAGSIIVGPACTNCTFAADGKTLYITANRGLYRIELNTDEALPDGAAGDQTGHLEDMPDVRVEVSALLPRPISANAATSIEVNKESDPWTAFRGTQANILDTETSVRTLMMRAVYAPDGSELLRVGFDAETYGDFVLWWADHGERPLRVIDRQGDRHEFIGVAGLRDDAMMYLSLREGRRRTHLPHAGDYEEVVLFFQLPDDVDAVGLTCGDGVLAFDAPIVMEE